MKYVHARKQCDIGELDWMTNLIKKAPPYI